MAAAGNFTPLIGSIMQFGATPLLLQAVDELPSGFFSLILEGPASPVLPEGSYDAACGERDFGPLYIMPIHTRDSSRQDYQVAFN